MIIHTRPNGSRVAFMPADIDRQYDVFNLPDHGNLLANEVRWAAKDSIPLVVEGSGMVDCNLYEQSNRMVLHLVNLTNSATWRAPIDDLITVGPFQVKVKMNKKVTTASLRLLVSDEKISPVIQDGWVSFEIKSIFFNVTVYEMKKVDIAVNLFVMNITFITSFS